MLRILLCRSADIPVRPGVQPPTAPRIPNQSALVGIRRTRMSALRPGFVAPNAPYHAQERGHSCPPRRPVANGASNPESVRVGWHSADKNVRTPVWHRDRKHDPLHAGARTFLSAQASSRQRRLESRVSPRWLAFGGQECPRSGLASRPQTRSIARRSADIPVRPGVQPPTTPRIPSQSALVGIRRTRMSALLPGSWHPNAHLSSRQSMLNCFPIQSNLP